jgi:hypothetical protein
MKNIVGWIAVMTLLKALYDSPNKLFVSEHCYIAFFISLGADA